MRFNFCKVANIIGLTAIENRETGFDRFFREKLCLFLGFKKNALLIQNAPKPVVIRSVTLTIFVIHVTASF
ncbi:hypothetical protein DUE52_27365 [Larkinella punicea]|uniref:Uncharacterized protein n=1 Tax=Larkinella punicea TaxID=2315727 RepID=A0A368JF26_9BACT|nr:hypothetical protein DUE52_27365 [Larkinella punicea]